HQPDVLETPGGQGMIGGDEAARLGRIQRRRPSSVNPPHIRCPGSQEHKPVSHSGSWKFLALTFNVSMCGSLVKMTRS
ncbi:hypothetical protein, partial [Rhizobium ecuadorense]|uniref:hypothetical protein n=1 Tax=Rhizobium ecuadorense TaxID=1671795 RepID=UPI001AEBE414